MNPQDPLAALNPLREPDVIGWWPLAPGWWLMVVVLALLSLALLYYLLRRYRANAYRRQALRQLKALRQTFDDEGQTSDYIHGVNALLKSVALQAYPRRTVAGHSGEQWLDFLNSSAGKGIQFEAAFVTAGYHRTCPQLDIDDLNQSASEWIRRHEVAR